MATTASWDDPASVTPLNIVLERCDLIPSFYDRRLR